MNLGIHGMNQKSHLNVFGSFQKIKQNTINILKMDLDAHRPKFHQNY